MFLMHFLCFLSGISIEYLPHIVLSPVASREDLCQPHKLIKLDREREGERERESEREVNVKVNQLHENFYGLLNECQTSRGTLPNEDGVELNAKQMIIHNLGNKQTKLRWLNTLEGTTVKTLVHSSRVKCARLAKKERERAKKRFFSYSTDILQIF